MDRGERLEMRRARGGGLAIVLAVVLSGCATAPPASPQPAPASQAPTPALATSTAPPPTPALTAPPGGSEVGGIGVLRCSGDQVGSAIDYAQDARGTTTDLIAATRVLGGVRPTDLIGLGAGATSVIRDGRTIWIGTWFEAPGGWLLSGFTACGDAGIASGE